MILQLLNSQQKKRIRFFIGRIDSVDDDDDTYNMTFLRKKVAESSVYFVFPEIEDAIEVEKKNKLYGRLCQSMEGVVHIFSIILMIMTLNSKSHCLKMCINAASLR